MSEQTLNLAEIMGESGKVQFRYARYLASDGSHWIRHGRFESYHSNGALASEGEYRDGLEQGLWRDYHLESSLAAEGEYKDGKKVGEWTYCDLPQA